MTTPTPQPAPGATAELPPLVPTPPPAATAAPSRRTGSPIIPPGPLPALLTAALAALTAGAAPLGRPVLAVAAVLLQAVTAAGWFRLNGMWPARQGIALAFLAGVTADVALLLAPADRAPVAVLGTLGAWIPLIVIQQMRHRGGADERLSSLMAMSASTVLAVLAAGYLAVAGQLGAHPVVLGAVGAGLATLVRAVPLPSPVTLVLAVLAAAGGGYGVAHWLGMSASSVVIAAVAGVCAVIGLRVASYDWPSRFVHFTAGVALPLALAAPAVWTAAGALGR
jgi:hypothetical protein